MATDYSQYNWDSGGMSPDELDGFRDNIINTFLQKASSVINAEQDPAKKAKMEAALENRVNAISGAFDKYGPTAFDPNLSSKNQHPEDSSLDVPNYMPSNPTGDLPFSPYSPDALTKEAQDKQAAYTASRNDPTVPSPSADTFLSPQEQYYMAMSGNSPNGSGDVPSYLTDRTSMDIPLLGSVPVPAALGNFGTNASASLSAAIKSGTAGLLKMLAPELGAAASGGDPRAEQYIQD